MSKLNSYSIMGMKVHDVNMEESLETIDGFVKQGGSHLVVTLGVEMVMASDKDTEFRDIVNSASLVTPDSVGILWAGRRAGYPLRQRVPGVELLEAAARESAKYGWRTFFLGAKPGVAKAAGEKLKEKYPGFNFVGEYHGYFKNDEEPLKAIEEAKPEIIFIALGFPAQEKWFMRNKDRLGNMVGVGVGGSFDVISGTIKRAPAVFRKLGLEWFHRLITQPSRIMRMAVLPAFALKVLFKGV